MNLKLTLLTVTGNLIGALLTFLYFSYVSVGADRSPLEGPSIHYVIFFIIGTGLIFSIITMAVRRWTSPLDEFFKTSRSLLCFLPSTPMITYFL